MITTPLLKNDYLTAGLIAESLHVAQPASYVSNKDHLKPSLWGSQLHVTAGTAWVSGTVVKATTDEKISLPTSVKDGEKFLVVLSVAFDGETAPELKVVKHSYFPTNASGGWYQKPGERMDFPIAYLYREKYWWKLTDVRMASSTGVFSYYGSPNMSEVYAAPFGTLYRSNDGLFYMQAFVGGAAFRAPQNPDVFRTFDLSIIEAQRAKNGIDISGVSYAVTTETVRAVGYIFLTEATGNELIWPIKTGTYNTKIGVTDTGEPVFIKKKSNATVLVNRSGGRVTGEYVNVDFEAIGGVE